MAKSPNPELYHIPRPGLAARSDKIVLSHEQERRESAAGALIRILISACLIGEPVRYNGVPVSADDARLRRWREEGRLIPFCPEVAGGLEVPRPPCEISGSRVVNAEGRDVTGEFQAGAAAAVEAARAAGARIAILKDRSPSCGVTRIHDGSFTGVTVPGMGIAARRLAANGIGVFSEGQIADAAALLEEHEGR